ncbi:MAG: bifunctional (p)ppGpp synthetase/guanosine-3',5'-bis(diphosphate) 3'-pyrophosphohydrolase [Fimbriimonadaceae bacterium]|nr:bifunctional (p)ppGpp synthetase/guanosine-3',5'-bis(diphosphate) 3'-pyrophosphohydrolase [Fimbriimonadaceae bacterium]
MASPVNPSDSTVPGWEQLLATFAEHWPDESAEKITLAFETARLAHEGQFRKTGEPYIIHPVAVAIIVAEIGMDEDSICAALMHDVLEDTELTAERIEELFGADIRAMVEGVTKLVHQKMLEGSVRERAAAESVRAAESLRKLLLAMADDFRVMVIKLADRLHNMQTLGAMAIEKQTRIANETLEVYAPIAARLGIWQLKWQLEDLAFKTLHPDEYQRIRDTVSKSRKDREKELDEAIEELKIRLEEVGLKDVKVVGRPKHLYSIFNKHVKQGVAWEDILDLIAIRVICERQHECYLALGIVTEIWKPIPGLFTDYIQNPKSNGYQSLHTKVIGPSGEPLEVQVRTREMHEIAEFGIAAHWTYKEGSGKPNAVTSFSQLRKQLFDWSNDNSSSSDFLRSVSTDLFAEQVFAFTPGGDVVDLPAGSTPIDFAFRVHTKLGENLVMAKINGDVVPLGASIKNGDVVEIISRGNAQPSLDWLEHAKSPHTRAKIRAYFRKRDRNQIVQRGRDALDRELRSAGFDPRIYMRDEIIKKISKKVKDSDSVDDVFARLGEGLTSVQSVVDKIRLLVAKDAPVEETTTKTASPAEPTLVTSIDQVMTKRARCCQPVPGEEVVGFVTRGRGIMIHRRLCPNMMSLAEEDAGRVTPVKWQSDGKTYPVDLSITCVNRQGLLMDITTIFGESKTNVNSARIKTLPNNTAEILITIDVADIQALRALMTKISNFGDVLSLLRVHSSGGRR